MRSSVHRIRSNRSSQKGQAYAETVVGFVVIGLFLMGAHHLWRTAEVGQQITDASRFAAWERVVWEPEDNTVEKFAVHQSNESLARNVVMHQFSKPSAWREFKRNLQANGTPAPSVNAIGANQRKANLKPALQVLVPTGQDPNNLVQVSTESGWTNDVERAFRGMDPTGGTLTSLELDRDTYRTVRTNFTSLATPNLQNGIFSFVLPNFQTSKKLSLITNTWAASPPVNFVRTERQLLPLSKGHAPSGTKANTLAHFGQDGIVGRLVGMAPWWDLVGGPNGFAGQYVVRQLGIDGAAVTDLYQTGGRTWSGGWDPEANGFDGNFLNNLMIAKQYHQAEYFNPHSVSSWHHRHTFVIDGMPQKKGDQWLFDARNSSVGKRKYRAISLRNPVEQYFTSP
jgi:hypothetical protein